MSGVLEYLKNSFLKPLLDDDMITDISFNGEHVFYEHNELGRMKSDIIVSNHFVLDFIRQISNMSEVMFTVQNPIIDLSIHNFRFNATHPSISRNNYEKVATFSLRKTSRDKASSFASSGDKYLDFLFKKILESKNSLVIAGKTGSGKTELQKYLLTSLADNTRIVLIDNVLELECIRTNEKLDIVTWLCDEKYHYTNFATLIRNALRNNPDYLVIAESRGGEMNDVLNSALTGTPIITTLHALKLESIPQRMARMILQKDSLLSHEVIMQDIYLHFSFLVFMKKEVNSKGHIVRYISDLAYIDESGKINRLYSLTNGVKKYEKPCKNALKLLNISSEEHIFMEEIIGEK